MTANMEPHRFEVGDHVKANSFGCGKCAFCNKDELIVVQVLSPSKVRCGDPTGLLTHPDYRDFDTYGLDLVQVRNTGQGEW